LGFWRFTGLIGTALSPVVFAALSDKVGYPSAFVMVSVSASMVVLLLILFVPETRRREVSV
jgi:sugar phosphate permease